MCAQPAFKITLALFDTILREAEPQDLMAADVRNEIEATDATRK